MLRYLILTTVCLSVGIESVAQTNASSASVNKASGNPLPGCGNQAITITSANSKRINLKKALRYYTTCKKKAFRNRSLDEMNFCPTFKFLKCGHFPNGTLSEHLCIDEVSVRTFAGVDSAYYDGIRLYPSTRYGRLIYLLVFTKKSRPTANTANASSTHTAYNDRSDSPIIELRSASLRQRLCDIGPGPDNDGQETALSAHLLCTPHCPEGGSLLFDY